MPSDKKEKEALDEKKLKLAWPADRLKIVLHCRSSVHCRYITAPQSVAIFDANLRPFDNPVYGF